MHEIERALPHSFVFFQPRDIVSGDFYWFSQKDDCAYIAAVDCTGHGVPGAFMSMIGNTLLNEIVNEKEVSDPGEVLSHLNAAVNHSLKQAVEGAESKDGMDIALVKIKSNTETGTEIHYAGANRPLYHVKPKDGSEFELLEYKASKFPIGGYDQERNKIFQTNKISLNKGETFYIFTDGYADQFGGPKGKKFMLKNFQSLLCDIQQHGMNDQKEIIRKNINDWKNTAEQVDDILVIGIKA
jgi:serine phosphatase RsbU (regulator of sigma subunit)